MVLLRFLELSSSKVFVFSVWLAELDFCCKYTHFKFKAINRKRCQIKSVLLYNSLIGENIKVENIDTSAWVLTVLIIPVAQCLRVDFSKYTHEGLGCWCLYKENQMGYSRYPIRKYQLTLNYPAEKYTFRAVYQL